ncbi:MAG: hypothetical protein GY928_01715, partial [Colwellia sp.]|nr:hypothetical protein [Colwellia sp.]
NGTQEVALSFNDLNITVMSWQPQANILLTEATNYKDTCYYAAFDLSSLETIPNPKLIKKCDKEARGYAQLSLDGEKMFHIELDENNLGGEIYQWNIISQKDNLLIPSQNAQFGIKSLKVSPNGNYIAYTWHKRGAPSHLYLFDLTTREQTLMHQASKEHIPFPYEWQRNSEAVNMIDTKSLITFNIDKKQAIKRNIAVNQWFLDLSSISDSDYLAAEEGRSNYQLIEYHHLFEQQALTQQVVMASEGADYFPTAAKSSYNKRFFVSSRSGQAQIWQAKEGDISQLSQFPSDESNAVYTLALSGNAQYLLFTRNEKLQFIDLSSGKLHSIPELNDQIATSYIWHKNDRTVLYSALAGNISQIWQFDIMTRERKMLTKTGGEKLLKSNTGIVYYVNDNNLISLAFTPEDKLYQQEITIPLPQCWCSLSLTEDFLYSNTKQKTLYRMNIRTGEVTTTDLPNKISGFYMLSDQSLIATQVSQGNSQIKRITWQEEQ